MRKPNILLFGNNTIATECLSYLIKNGENVLGIIPESSDNGIDDWQKSFRKVAKKLNVKVYDTISINDESFLRMIKKLNIDFIFSLQCRRIFKKELLSIPKYGCFNLHFSFLPKHRGCHVVAWTLISGDVWGGVTFISMKEGVDNGDIIFQKTFDIPITMTGRELFDKCTKEGIRLFKESYQKIISGRFNPKPQNESQASYHKKGSVDFNKNQIHWNEDYKKLHNWCRAFIFPPFQYPVTFYRGNKIEIVKLDKPSKKNKRRDLGSIISFGNNINVAAKNGSISIRAVKINDEVLSASEFIKKYNLKLGDEFGVR